jgi:hypothetical protein
MMWIQGSDLQTLAVERVLIYYFMFRHSVVSSSVADPVLINPWIRDPGWFFPDLGSFWLWLRLRLCSWKHKNQEKNGKFASTLHVGSGIRDEKMVGSGSGIKNSGSATLAVTYRYGIHFSFACSEVISTQILLQAELTRILQRSNKMKYWCIDVEGACAWGMGRGQDAVWPAAGLPAYHHPHSTCTMRIQVLHLLSASSVRRTSAGHYCSKRRKLCKLKFTNFQST